MKKVIEEISMKSFITVLLSIVIILYHDCFEMLTIIKVEF